MPIPIRKGAGVRREGGRERKERRKQKRNRTGIAETYKLALKAISKLVL
jgi:hypothetical protein